MNYSKVGPLTEAVVKVAELKGFEFPKLVVREWTNDILKLDLVCFKQGDLDLVKHTLYNEDVVYESMKRNLRKKNPCFKIKIPVTFDRLHNVYAEHLMPHVHRAILELDIAKDPLYQPLESVLALYQTRRLMSIKDNLHRDMQFSTKSISDIDERIHNVTTEKLYLEKEEENEDEQCSCGLCHPGSTLQEFFNEFSKIEKNVKERKNDLEL